MTCTRPRRAGTRTAATVVIAAVGGTIGGWAWRAVKAGRFDFDAHVPLHPYITFHPSQESWHSHHRSLSEHRFPLHYYPRCESARSHYSLTLAPRFPPRSDFTSTLPLHLF